MATYDLNAIADAIADVFNDLPTGNEVEGESETMTGYAEVTGTPNVPAAVVELDDIVWDVTMGRGGDAFTFLVTALVQASDSKNGQRALRAFLSTGGGVGRMKDALEEDKTLGGLVSFAVMTNARRTGLIRFNDVDYMGAELVVEVMS